eukprot:7238145-Heterocapsa_arctica.AAC.1
MVDCIRCHLNAQVHLSPRWFGKLVTEKERRRVALSGAFLWGSLTSSSAVNGIHGTGSDPVLLDSGSEAT